jgi:hypothetical protein
LHLARQNRCLIGASASTQVRETEQPPPLQTSWDDKKWRPAKPEAMNLIPVERDPAMIERRDDEISDFRRIGSQQPFHHRIGFEELYSQLRMQRRILWVS